MWSKLTRAIVAKDMDAATEAKTAVEESQREARRRMDERGEVHVPRFFQERNGRWEPKLQCVSSLPSSSPVSFDLYRLTCAFRLPSNPQEAIQAVEKFIWPTLPPSYVS